MLFIAFWHISVSFTRDSLQWAAALETGSSFQKLVETAKLIDSSSTLNAIFGMKRRASYKLKCSSLFGLMTALVIFKYSLCVHVYV